MIKKLVAHGIEGDILRWIEKWLTDRRQRVNINGKLSSWMEVLSGVPQGSVLGRLLFLILVNDIDDGIVSKLLKFTDDIKLCNTVVNEEDADYLRSDLRKLSRAAAAVDGA